MPYRVARSRNRKPGSPKSSVRERSTDRASRPTRFSPGQPSKVTDRENSRPLGDGTGGVETAISSHAGPTSGGRRVALEACRRRIHPNRDRVIEVIFTPSGDLRTAETCLGSITFLDDNRYQAVMPSNNGQGRTRGTPRSSPLETRAATATHNPQGASGQTDDATVESTGVAR